MGPAGNQRKAGSRRIPIDPGSTVWITSTIEVRVGCPRPLPVLFDVTYTTLARELSAQLAGFGDLGDVPLQRFPYLIEPSCFAMTV